MGSGKESVWETWLPRPSESAKAFGWYLGRNLASEWDRIALWTGGDAEETGGRELFKKSL